MTWSGSDHLATLSSCQMRDQDRKKLSVILRKHLFWNRLRYVTLPEQISEFGPGDEADGGGD